MCFFERKMFSILDAGFLMLGNSTIIFRLKIRVGGVGKVFELVKKNEKFGRKAVKGVKRRANRLENI
jgi:hypothetical protein